MLPRMLKLHGFSSSNYYNIVKLTLLEKKIEFEEVLVYSGAGDKYRSDYLDMSPQGKIPCLETAEGFLTESRAICAYLEETYPEPPLYPASPFARAKTVELVHVLDLYLDLPVRRIVRNYFGAKKPPDRIADEVRESLGRTAATLRKLARFDRYLLGEHFGAADVSAANHFPFARTICRQVLDFDPLASLPGVDDYLARLEERPAVRRVEGDRLADLPNFVAHIRRLYAE